VLDKMSRIGSKLDDKNFLKELAVQEKINEEIIAKENLSMQQKDIKKVKEIYNKLKRNEKKISNSIPISRYSSFNSSMKNSNEFRNEIRERDKNIRRISSDLTSDFIAEKFDELEKIQLIREKIGTSIDINDIKTLRESEQAFFQRKRTDLLSDVGDANMDQPKSTQDVVLSPEPIFNSLTTKLMQMMMQNTIKINKKSMQNK